MSSIWLESSKTEIELARIVVQKLQSDLESPSLLCRVMESLALRLTGNQSSTSTCTHTETIINTLLHELPELTEIHTIRPFPEKHTDLTANFFSRLAYELGALRDDPTLRGVVGTPSVLAVDMVALAAVSWLAKQVDMPESELRAVVFGTRTASSVEIETLRNFLARVTWYDPCIGGGVFPVSIILLLGRFGVGLDRKQLLKIWGGDLDPVSVTASYIRVALAVSSMTKTSYAIVRQNLPNMFTVGDSLEHNAEQNSHWSDFLMMRDGTDSPTMTEAYADIVVANPPYVRADRIPERQKRLLKSIYPTVAGGSVDLYNYFLAHGLLSLKQDGILCYVSPANFQKSKYGIGTRKYVHLHGNVQTLFDFNELPIFNGASLHASVYAIAKTHTQSMVRAYAYTDLPKYRPLFHGLEHATILSQTNIGVEGWHAARFASEGILGLLRKNTMPLIDYVGHILSGIKTGYRKAFLISLDEAKGLKSEEDSAKFIKPLLLPITIRTWKTNWDGTHLIYIRKGESVPSESLLMSHLLVYETPLRQRSDIQGHLTWYGLRECTYERLFAQPKIVFPDIASDCRFAMDTEGFFVSDGAFMIPLNDYFLLGILNSCIGRFYFRAVCTSIGNPQDGGRLRFKKTYVEEFPVPKRLQETASLHDEIADLARSLTGDQPVENAVERIDELSLELYRVPEQYWQLVKEGH